MKAAVKDPRVIKLDVRDVDEWIGESSSPYGKDFCPRKGQLPGAVWLEWYRMMKPTPVGPMFKSPAEILAECATVGITPETSVVIYCFKGARAANTFVALEEAGIKNVAIYFGSWNEWSRATRRCRSKQACPIRRRDWPRDHARSGCRQHGAFSAQPRRKARKTTIEHQRTTPVGIGARRCHRSIGSRCYG